MEWFSSCIVISTSLSSWLPISTCESEGSGLLGTELSPPHPVLLEFTLKGLVGWKLVFNLKELVDLVSTVTVPSDA